MIRVINNFDEFKYTKVNVLICLNECPSDDENNRRFIELACDEYTQQNCYIGNQLVEEISVKRVQKVEHINDDTICAKWNVEIILPVAKSEEEVLKLLKEYCDFLTLALSKHYKAWNRKGLGRFDFKLTDVQRNYAKDDRVFENPAMNTIGMISTVMKTTLDTNIFELPVKQSSKNDFYDELKKAFVIGMESKDVVSRYLLLYYMFEIMYATTEYQKLKNTYEANLTEKKDGNTKRSEILFDYLQQHLGINEYYVFGNVEKLTVDNLLNMISTRNDLTHRADTTKISNVLYKIMIPILQQVLLTQGK